MSDHKIQDLEHSRQRNSEAAFAFAEDLLMSMLALALCVVFALT
jgi:hypothetical protein